MKFSLDCVVKNSTGSQRALSEQELEKITDGLTSSSGVVLSSGDEASLLCDLNNRYDVSSIKYYYTGGDVDIYVSEVYNVWSTASLTYFSDRVECEFSEVKPRWFKIEHGNISTSGIIYEFEVYNSDENILFGSSGQYDSYGIDISGIIISEVSIFNSSGLDRDIYVFIGDNSSSEDTEALLEIGTTSSGIFYNKRDLGINIPRDYPWDNGKHQGTIIVGNELTVSGTSVSGVYYSPIFDIYGNENSRFFWDYESNGGGVDYKGSVDSKDCFGFRSSNVQPASPWVEGILSEEDSYWSTSSGSLQFIPVCNNQILNIGSNRYVQFCVNVSGIYPNYPTISRAGIEKALTVSSVPSNGYKNIYVATSSGTYGNKNVNLVCWYSG